jgi:hypothetical protein
MSVRCTVCGEYIYRGKKFNSRKETVQGEEYLGIKIFRFYQKCPNCAVEFSFKTDPKESDYLSEFNCTRNFEPWKARDAAADEVKKMRQEEDEGDAIRALENKTLDSKIEMDITDALDEIRALNARNAKVDAEQLLQERRERERQLSADEERELQSIFFKNAGGIKRLITDDLDQIDDDDDDNDIVALQERKKMKLGDVDNAKAIAPKATEALPSIRLLPKSNANATDSTTTTTGANSGTTTTTTTTARKPAVVVVTKRKPIVTTAPISSKTTTPSTSTTSSLVDY